jgi:hypothetical protein
MHSLSLQYLTHCSQYREKVQQTSDHGFHTAALSAQKQTIFRQVAGKLARMCNGFSTRESEGGALVVLKLTSMNTTSTLKRELSLKLAEDATTGKTLATINDLDFHVVGSQVIIQYVNLHCR